MINNGLYSRLFKNAHPMGDIDVYDGGVNLFSDGGKYYWSIDDRYGQNWKEIPEYLYMAVLKYQEEYKHTF